MLYPSVDSLKEKIDSKYILVTLASKRARQIQENNQLILKEYKAKKDVGKALEEIAAGALTQVEADESAVYEDEI